MSSHVKPHDRLASEATCDGPTAESLAAAMAMVKDKLPMDIDESYQIAVLSLADEEQAVDLIRHNLTPYEEAGSVLASSYRRLQNLCRSFTGDGRRFMVLKKQDIVIGCAGIAPLAGLPKDEGNAEISELVIDEKYRGQGLGAHLLVNCINYAFEIGYERIYLETTPGMKKARALFDGFGFRPITDKNESAADQRGGDDEPMPCYYLLQKPV